jgi:integrase
MARRTRATALETRTARLKLPISKKPYWITIGHGLGIGFRRNQGPGTWSGRQADGKGGYQTFAVATADDYDESNGASILTYYEAQDRIRAIGLGRADDDGSKLGSVGEALQAYRADLAARGGEAANAGRVAYHLPPSLASKLVAQLNARELRKWRDSLLEKGLAPATVSRTCKALSAALSLAAASDPRVKNGAAWKVGLAMLPDSAKARSDAILTDDEVRRIVTEAIQEGEAFKLLVEVLALTGCRPSQARRLVVSDVLADKLMMPTSRKGKGKRRVERKPVPIPHDLAARLKLAARGRAIDAPLLLKADGQPWGKTDHRDPMRRTVQRVGLDPDNVTAYNMRHTSIVRMLKHNVPTAICADHHNTSEAQIKAHYAKYILDHSDAITRGALLDLSEPASTNVVPIRDRQ